jgi:GDP-4-dehydro-6-deoxy-D-mannose reductase
MGEVTHIFHLAAITFVPESEQSPAGTFACNTLGTINLIQEILATQRQARLIFISTSEVYGPPLDLPVTEDHPLNPMNPYAISKAAADEYCGWAHRALGLDVVRLRPFNHIGPGQSDRFVVSSLARQFARIQAGKQPPELAVGNLDVARDFSDVTDIVRGYEAAAIAGASGQVYNICSGCATSIQDIVIHLQRISGMDVRIVQSPDRTRPLDIPEIRGSYSRLKSQVCWSPEITLDKTIENVLKYWKNLEIQ